MSKRPTRKGASQRESLACLPWWWFVPYVGVFVIYVVVVIVLIDRGVSLTEAVCVPGLLGAAVIAALTRFARIMRVRPAKGRS